MALGGGSFVTTNKILPGSYINFVSAKRATAMLSERGIAALALELDWCPDGVVFEVTNEDFKRYSLENFGYEYDNHKLKGLRDLFKNIKKGYFYKLNGGGVKASNIYAAAKYTGVRGNDIKIVIEKNVDDATKFDVYTLLDTKKVDKQTVKLATELKANKFVDFKTDATLTVTASSPLSGGTNGTTATGAEYQSFLNKIESYNFNALGCLATTDEIKNLFVAFTKRMRNDVGVKFQTVLYKSSADFEGIVSVDNSVKGAGEKESSMVYWTLGAQAGCDVSKSLTNTTYDGEFIPNTEYTQLELEEGLLAGKFIFHNVDGEVRVLEDINTFVTYTEQMNEDFSSNQTVRILDQIAKDTAAIFNNKYLGKFPNTPSGRVSLWNDVVDHRKEMQKKECIEDFKADDVEVIKGATKKSVVVNEHITVINAMTQLFMTVSVQ